MTTADYLESLQNDLNTIVNTLELDEGTNFTNIAEMVNEGEISKGGGGSEYTGHYDAAGLSQIGWTNEDIQYYQDNAVMWNSELDNQYKLRNDELQGTVNSYVRFLPKNATIKNFQDYSSMIAMPYLNISQTNWASAFRYCENLITIPLFNTSNATSMNNLFDSCYNLKTIPLLDTSKLTTMVSMFYSCYNLKNIPLLNTSNVTNMQGAFWNCWALRSIPQLNTSNVTNMRNTFNGCVSLVDLPVLDTSKVTIFQATFSNCFSLSDESLNNILLMCKNATSYTGTKTLSAIGFETARYSTRLQTLSNYQAFVNAGWSIS